MNQTSTEDIPTDTDNLSDEFYKSLVESAGDVIYVCNMQGRCTYVNSTVERLFGWSPDEVIGHRFTEFIHPEWRNEVEAFYIHQFQERKPETQLEFPALTREGVVKWVEQVVFLEIEGEWVTGFRGFVRDISARKQAEDRLKAIIDAVPDHIYVKDCEHRFMQVNRATWMNEGYDRAEDMIGLTDIDLYGDAGRADWEMEERLLQTGEPINNHERENHKPLDKGRREVVLINKVPLYDDNGAVIGMIGINRDITERKLAESQLLESGNMLRTIIDSSPDLIFIKDKTLHYKMFNPAGERVMGIPVKDIINKTDSDLFDSEIGVETAQIDREVMESGKPTSYEITRIIGGEKRWFHIYKAPYVDDKGDITGVIGFGRDVTERKKAEEESLEYIRWLEILQKVDIELNQTLDFDQVLKTALDAAVRLSRANAGAIHLAHKGELVVAQVIGDYPPEMVGVRYPARWGIVGRVMRTQIPEWVKDVTADADYVGNVPDMLSQITVPLTSQDRQIGTLNVQGNPPDLFTDKTFDFIKLLGARIAAALDNARLYREQEIQYKQLSELEQLKTQLIHVAAHDIRGPLGVVSGYVQVMADDPKAGLTERGQDHLRMIEQAAERIDKITRDILTLDRVERMQSGANTETVDLAEITRMVFQEFHPQATHKGLHYSLDAVASSMIKGDRVFLREAVVNLINNAIKYTPAGGQIAIRLNTENGYTNLEVRDTGYGIPKDQQSDLFKPFSRVKLPETREIKGTGLGLHLVKNIVEGHGGVMIFQSEHGKGSTFGFKLPRQGKDKRAKKR